MKKDLPRGKIEITPEMIRNQENLIQLFIKLVKEVIDKNNTDVTNGDENRNDNEQ